MRESMKGHSVKACSVCKIIKPLSAYRYTNKKQASRRADCIECERRHKQNKVYKEKQRVYSRDRRTDDAYRQRETAMSKAYGQTIKGRATRLWLAAKHRSKIQNAHFNICKAHIEIMLIMGVCERTGIPFDFSSPEAGKNFNPYAPSIDKRDPHGGYTHGNIQIVCNAYNLAKNQFTDEQFIAFCKLVVNRHA